MIVGKGGPTSGVVKSLAEALKARRVLKVKVLKNLLAHRPLVDVAIETAKRVGAHLIEVRGNTFTLSVAPIPKYQRKIPKGGFVRDA